MESTSTFMAQFSHWLILSQFTSLVGLKLVLASLFVSVVTVWLQEKIYRKRYIYVLDSHMKPFFTSGARTARPAGPIVALRFRVCLSVRLSRFRPPGPGNGLTMVKPWRQRAQWRGNEHTGSLTRYGAGEAVAAGTYGWFKLAGLFASSLQKGAKHASTIESRGTALLAHAQNRERAPEAQQCQ